MLHLASGNKNKKKFIVGVGRDGKAKGRVATRTVFGKEEEGGEGLEEKTMEEEQPRGATKEGSPSWTPGSPPAVGNEGVQSVAGNAGVEQGVEKVVAVAPKGKGKGGKKEQQKREWKPQGGLGTPSERRDLPPNVVVTKVNVERDGWVAGAGPVVEGTSSTWVQTPWVRQAVLDLGWAKEVAVEQELKEIEWEGEWKGWPGVESVEKSWDSLAVLSVADGASRVGAKVVTKVRSTPTLLPS